MTDAETLERMMPLVYEELRRIAHRELGDRRNDTLSTTGLVHELYLRLAQGEHREWSSRAHFLGTAAIAMRRILVDVARQRTAAKRGGAWRPITLDEETAVVAGDAEWLLELDDALTRLGQLDERLARVVECRFYGGMTEQETAEALQVTERTVRRDWVKARGLLYASLAG